MAISSTLAAPHASQALAVVVMGVSGAGKTVVGRRLAAALGADFIDGDDLHTDAARAKMSSGQPLYRRGSLAMARSHRRGAS